MEAAVLDDEGRRCGSADLALGFGKRTGWEPGVEALESGTQAVRQQHIAKVIALRGRLAGCRRGTWSHLVAQVAEPLQCSVLEHALGERGRAHVKSAL